MQNEISKWLINKQKVLNLICNEVNTKLRILIDNSRYDEDVELREPSCPARAAD